MKRIDKKMLLITALVVLLPLLAGLLLWNRLPDVMTSHWNAQGEADGQASKGFSVFFTPLFLLFMHLVCVGATALDTGNQKQARKALYIAYWAMPVTSLFAGFTIYGTALGFTLNPNRVFNVFFGIAFMLIGNYLPKTMPNKVIGIRTAQTLGDEEIWHQTHRIMGKVWLLGGLVLILLALILPAAIQIPALLIVLALLALASAAYAIHLKRKKN